MKMRHDRDMLDAPRPSRAKRAAVAITLSVACSAGVAITLTAGSSTSAMKMRHEGGAMTPTQNTR